MNLSFVLPELHPNILKTARMLQFGTRNCRRTWHVISTQEVNTKVDAVPGRINQLNLFSIRPGLFFGQCSEICGINHRFIPIMLERTDYYNFIN